MSIWNVSQFGAVANNRQCIAVAGALASTINSNWDAVSGVRTQINQKQIVVIVGAVDDARFSAARNIVKSKKTPQINNETARESLSHTTRHKQHSHTAHTVTYNNHILSHTQHQHTRHRQRPKKQFTNHSQIMSWHRTRAKARQDKDKFPNNILFILAHIEREHNRGHVHSKKIQKKNPTCIVLRGALR